MLPIQPTLMESVRGLIRPCLTPGYWFATFEGMVDDEPSLTPHAKASGVTLYLAMCETVGAWG